MGGRVIKKLFSKGSWLGLSSCLLGMFSFVLVICDYQTHWFLPFREVLSLALSPIQYVANLPTEIFHKVEIEVATKKELIKENANLRTEQLLLRAQIQKLAFLEQENGELRALLGFSAKIKDKVVTAQLLAADFNNLNKQVIINKGKNNGVYVGQPVIDANGFIGQVIAVDTITSRVLLITDTESAIPVIDVRTGMRFIAMGVGTSTGVELEYVPDTYDVKVSDLIVTSNLGNRLPEGYPVGVIDSIRHIPGERFAKIALKPSAHVDTGRYVLVLWPGELKIEKNVKDAEKDNIKSKNKTRSKSNSSYI